MEDKGIVYVVYGAKAAAQMPLNERALADAGMGHLPVMVIDQEVFPRRDAGARWSKLHLDILSPFDHTLYLDADTRVRADISVGFDILAAGWDVVITPSTSQADRLFQHIGEAEKEHTFEELQNPFPLQLQGGVIFFRKGKAVAALFEAWRQEWELYQDQDQAALLRALDRAPVKTWLLSSEFNGGSLVDHYFGQARERTGN